MQTMTHWSVNCRQQLSQENFRIHGSLDVLLVSYFKQEYIQVSSTSQNISKARECRGMTIRHDDGYRSDGVAQGEQSRDRMPRHLLQCPHKNRSMRWMTGLNCALFTVSYWAHFTDNSIKPHTELGTGNQSIVK